MVGLCTLFRPESPLLLIAAWIVLAVILFAQHEAKRWMQTVVGMGLICAIPLVPWTVRNAITLHEFQPLAPKYSNLPGELVPYGFMSWEKTWLYRFRDVYLVPWKLDDEAIRVDDIPAYAFDTPEEKERVAAILEPYNNDLTLTADEDAAFAQRGARTDGAASAANICLAAVARAAVMWFTPRIELIPVSGTVFPLVQSWQDDKVDQSVTVGFFLLNIAYVGACAWRRSATVATERGGAACARHDDFVCRAAHGVSHNDRNARAALRAGVLPDRARARPHKVFARAYEKPNRAVSKASSTLASGWMVTRWTCAEIAL